MQIALINGIIILTSGLLYLGARLGRDLPRRWLWSALVITLTFYVVLLWREVTPWLVSDILVLVISLITASIISFTLTSSSALIAFCITVGVVDFFSFSGGLSAKIIADYEQGHNLLLQYLCITVPLSDQIVPIIGIGDLIIMGSVYFALSRLEYHGWLAFLFPLGGLLTALAVGIWLGGIYALPFIGSTTIIYLLWKAKISSSPPLTNTSPK